MDVFEKMLTRVDLINKDGTTYACGLGCASALMNENQYDKILVINCSNYKQIPAMQAHYLFGSRIIPAKAMLPVLSFGKKADAENFQKLHGGTIHIGKTAFDTAAKIREERMQHRRRIQEQRD